MQIRKNQLDLEFRRLLALAALTSAFALMPSQVRSQTARELTTVRDVRGLTPDQAREGRPVRLRGVVTVFSGFKNSFFFQDPTAGISVSRTINLPEIQPGQSVEIRGFTGPGMFAPVVVADKLTVLGKGNMPIARVYGLDQLVGGKQDSQFLAIQGIVRSAVVKTIWERPVLVLEIDIGGGSLVTVRVHDFSREGLDRLPASTVSVRGVCGTVFNDKRQFIGLRLYVASLGDVKVEHPAPSDPFEMPTRPLNSLLLFGNQEGAIGRIKVRGTVTYSQPGQGIYIQDGLQGLFVQSEQTTPIAPGSQLEVVGYPSAGRYSPKLDDAVYRVVGKAPPLAPLSRMASSMIVYNDGSSAAPYDSVLVQLTGRLIEEVPSAHENLLFLKDGASVVTARLQQTGQNRRNLPTGSLLSITGVCVANADETHEARSFEILLRAPTDLVVLERGPWWTPSHAAWVVAALLIVVLAMAGWLAVVRWQAHLRALAVTDPLTGLYNRRGFLLFAENQWELALRRKTSFLLFYIDVDRFKEINDSMGHKAGDLALQSVADKLRHCFRKTDIIGRLGGDEFAITAVDAPPHTRSVLEERLAKALQEDNQIADRRFELSLSIGILNCDYSLGVIPIEDLLARADSLMYQQKHDRKARGF